MTATFTLAGNIRLVPRWEDDIGPADLSDTTTFLQTLAIENGTGTGQANSYWRDVITLAASAVWTYDGTALPLTVMSATGSLSIATPRMLYVRNRSTASALRWDSTDATVDIAPGGTLFWNAPATVTKTPFASATVTNIGAASAIFEVMIVGVKS